MTQPPTSPQTTNIVRPWELDGWGEKALITAGMRHAAHLSELDVAQQRKDTSPHLQAAVIDGNPTMGSGNVYQVAREDIEYDYIRDSKGKHIDIPAHWKLVGGLDVGAHTAFLKLAWDSDNDTLYVVDEFVGQHQPPAVVASGIRIRKGDKFPIMIDPAANGRTPIDGRRLMIEYRKEKLDVRNAENAVEAGIHACWSRFSTGRLKIFKHCVRTLKEYEMYQRDINGKIVKKNDHCMDALRYAVMGHRFAKLIYGKDDVDTSYNNPYDFSKF